MNNKIIQKNLQSNIWKHTVYLITNKRIFSAILGAYYLTIQNVTAQSIGTILLAGSLAGFLFEIPSGYISDKIGHKQALIFGKTALLFSSLFFLLANNILLLILGSVLMSIGYAFFSGTGAAFMHETLSALNKEEEYIQIMGKMRSIGYVVPIIFVALIPFLVNIDIKLPFVVAVGLDIIGLCVVLTYVVPQKSKKQIEEIGITNFKQVLKKVYKIGFFRYTLFLGIMSGFLFSVIGFRAAYQDFLQIPIIYYGIFVGISFVLASVLTVFSGKIKANITLKSLFMFQIVIFTFLFLLLGVISNVWIIISIFILIMGLQHGLRTVNGGFMMDKLKDEKFKATISSIGEQISKMTTAVIGFGLGMIINYFSYKIGFFSLGIAFCLILIPIYIYIFRSNTKRLYYKN